MNRAFIHSLEYICLMWLTRKSTVTETPMVKARVARVPMGGSWKEKILDYEIETGSYPYPPTPKILPWKEKILDYEIETLQQVRQGWCRLRTLKRKDSRLRDWNATDSKIQVRAQMDLEKKRFSITRLKLLKAALDGDTADDLKRKDSRLRDWNIM